MEMNSEIETDTDSTPTTPICRSNVPSPIPEAIDLTEPTPPPAWARTPSPDDNTPHALSFPTIMSAAPIPPVPTPAPVNPELTAIMVAISGMQTDLLDRIEKVNTRVDQATGPQNIPDYMAWNEENPAAFFFFFFLIHFYSLHVSALQDCTKLGKVCGMLCRGAEVNCGKTCM